MNLVVESCRELQDECTQAVFLVWSVSFKDLLYELQKIWSLNTTLSQALEQLCRHNEMTRNFEASMSSHSPPPKTGDLKLRYCVVASVEFQVESFLQRNHRVA